MIKPSSCLSVTWKCLRRLLIMTSDYYDTKVGKRKALTPQDWGAGKLMCRRHFFMGNPTQFRLNKKGSQKGTFNSRRQPDLNRWSGCCRPTPYRLAMSPDYIMMFFFAMLKEVIKFKIQTCLCSSNQEFNVSSPSRARTYNITVNSRALYHWAIEESRLP